MANHSTEQVVLPSVKTIARGVQWFILISILCLIPLLWWKSSIDINFLWRHLDALSLSLLIPLAGLDFVFGGLRFRLFFDGKVLPKISLWNCMRANWANVFLGAVTPFQSGGGPAQLYILWRCGAKISQATLVALIGFVATLLFYMIGGILALMLFPAEIFGKHVAPVVQGALLFLSGFTALVILVIIFPGSGLWLLRMIFRLIPPRLRRFRKLCYRTMVFFKIGVENFSKTAKDIFTYNRTSLVLVAFVTVALYLVKFLIGLVIARSLQQWVPFWIFMGLQHIQLLLLNFAPTPGGAGLAEASSFWLMETVMAVEFLFIYTVLWRFFTTHIGTFIGGMVFLQDARNWLKKSGSGRP